MSVQEVIAQGAGSTTYDCRPWAEERTCGIRAGSQSQSLIAPPAQASAICEAEGTVGEAAGQELNLRRQRSLTGRCDGRNVLVLQQRPSI